MKKKIGFITIFCGPRRVLSNVSQSRSPRCGACHKVHNQQDCFGVQKSAPSCNTFTIAPANPSSLTMLQDCSRKCNDVLVLLLPVLPHSCSPEGILGKMGVWPDVRHPTCDLVLNKSWIMPLRFTDKEIDVGRWSELSRSQKKEGRNGDGTSLLSPIFSPQMVQLWTD